MAPDRIDRLAWEVERVQDDHKDLENEHKELVREVTKGFGEVNDRLDRIVMVLLAGSFSILVFLFGVTFALLTGRL